MIKKKKIGPFHLNNLKIKQRTASMRIPMMICPLLKNLSKTKRTTKIRLHHKSLKHVKMLKNFHVKNMNLS